MIGYFKDKRGVTLIELILVLAIVLILGSLVELKGNRDIYYLKTEARMLCQKMRSLRLKNMTENTTYKIILKNNCYEVHRESKRIEYIVINENLELDDNIDDDNESYSTLRFNHNGSPKGCACTIIVKDKNTGQYMEITIAAVSGRVLLKDEIKYP